MQNKNTKRKKQFSFENYIFTCMCQYVSLEVIAAPKGSVAVVTDEILLDF